MPRRLPSALQFRRILRFSLFCLALPCVYFGGSCAAFLLRYRAANASASLIHLPSTPSPDSATRLMVFAPHCDDETLGCAGRIEQTRAAGGKVRVGILTNGDGYPAAVARQLRCLRAGPREFEQFAALRQSESDQALDMLGVPAKDVLYFGYPDRGLLALWNDHWSADSPYVSPFTECAASPYARTFHPGSHYCGKDLVEDIKSALRAFRPTVVTVTHPAEDHTDHAAAAAFVSLALLELQADPHEAAWAVHTRLDYYLIHRGDWPAPAEARPHAPLLPPAAMERTDTHWSTLELSPEQMAHKAHGIELYPSQTTVMPAFMHSFVRNSELYGEIVHGTLLTVPDGTISLHAAASDWEAAPPVLLDPLRDNLLRDMQGGGDIGALTLCRDSQYLYLRLDTRQPISARFQYTLRLRLFGPAGETETHTITFNLRSDQPQRHKLRIASRDRMLEAAIPLEMLTKESPAKPPRLLAVSMETSLSGVEIDRTGVRILSLK